MEVRTAIPTDYPALADLTRREGWNYSVEDFTALDRAGCAKTLVAAQSGAVRGMITILDYGSVGWISNVLVDKSLRGKRVGEELLQEGVRQLREKRTIALFSYQDSKKFYLKEGMKYDRDFCYVRFTGGGHGAAREGTLTEAVFGLDERSFGYTRRGLLKMLAESSRLAYPLRGEGFAILRPDPTEATVGPVVAENREEGMELLYASFNMLGKGSYAVVPDANIEGVQEVFRVSRMYYGEKPFMNPRMTFAFSGLELG